MARELGKTGAEDPRRKHWSGEAEEPRRGWLDGETEAGWSKVP